MMSTMRASERQRVSGAKTACVAGERNGGCVTHVDDASE